MRTIKQYVEEVWSTFWQKTGLLFSQKKFDLDPVMDYKAFCKKAYPVLYKNKLLFNREFDSLVGDGVLGKCDT